MNRRDFLRMLGTASAAGAAYPVLDKLDFLVRQPVSVIAPNPDYLLMDLGGGVWLDPVKKIISIRRYDRSYLTVCELHRKLSDAFDQPELITEKSPSMRITDHEIHMLDAKLDETSMQFLSDGTIVQGDEVYQSMVAYGDHVDEPSIQIIQNGSVLKG